MKRKLEDIELNTIKGFHIFNNTLVVNTEQETYSYEYRNSLEFLRIISILFHNYEVEKSRQSDILKKNNQNHPIYNKQQYEDVLRSMIKQFRVVLYIMGILGGVGLFWSLGNQPILIPYIIKFCFLGGICESCLFILQKLKITPTIEQQKQYDRMQQLERSYDSLKEATLSYLNRLSKTGVEINPEEKQYIEEMEKAIQKRIGSHPLL